MHKLELRVTVLYGYCVSNFLIKTNSLCIHHQEKTVIRFRYFTALFVHLKIARRLSKNLYKSAGKIAGRTVS